MYGAGMMNVKAKVLKDGHLFVVHILDPHLDISEEIPLSEIETEWQKSEETMELVSR